MTCCHDVGPQYYLQLRDDFVTVDVTFVILCEFEFDFCKDLFIFFEYAFVRMFLQGFHSFPYLTFHLNLKRSLKIS